MCLGLATGFIRKPQTYKVVIADYRADTKIYLRIVAKDFKDAFQKAQKMFSEPDCAIVSVMEV